jgi:mRNA interferase HigB
MRLITRLRLREYATLHPLAKASLERWRRIAEAADWKTPEDVRKSWKSVDFVRVKSGRTVAVFNVGGNHFRLIAAVHYDRQKVFILRFYPHHEYSKDDWKDEL